MPLQVAEVGLSLAGVALARVAEQLAQ